jgi:hypothetical protein
MFESDMRLKDAQARITKASNRTCVGSLTLVAVLPLSAIVLVVSRLEVTFGLMILLIASTIAARWSVSAHLQCRFLSA